MKRCISLLLIALLLSAPACAETDLSALSYEELAELHRQVVEAILDTGEWSYLILANGLIVHTPIAQKPSPDRYTYYVRDYTGRNAANAGQWSDWYGRYYDDYGKFSLSFDYLATDGNYVDPGDPEALKQYVVIGQDIAPNTEFKITYQKREDGSEYDNLVDTKGIERITLYLYKR